MTFYFDFLNRGEKEKVERVKMGRLWELRLQYAGRRMLDQQLHHIQTLLERGEIDMPSFKVTVSLPRDVDAIQTLTTYALDETDARSRVRRLLHELGWVIKGETDIISVVEVVK